MGRPLIDLTGKRFGRYVVVSRSLVSNWGETRWECVCDCGNTSCVNGTDLKRGTSSSCGCYGREMVSKAKRVHGQSHSPEHSTWAGMHKRCSNPKTNGFKNYGGKGIKVCERWQDFQKFLADMGPKPSREHTLDRVDRDGDYTPENCRWASHQVQQNNRSTNVVIEHQGQSMTVAEWARQTGLEYSTLWRRLFVLRWPIEKALQVLAVC